MQLTRAADYAIRVMVHVAGLPPGARLTRDQLSSSGDVPEHFLSKILQALSRGGLLTSQRGMAGGYTLAKPAGDISLLDVVEAIEGPLLLNVCLAPTGCDRKDWCPVHSVWGQAQEALAGVLRNATLARLAAQTAEDPGKCGGGSWT